MTVEATGYAAAQARVAQLRAMFGTPAFAATTGQATTTGSFDATLASALATVNDAAASVERPFIWDPAAVPGTARLKPGAAAVLRAASGTSAASGSGETTGAAAVQGTSGQAPATGGTRAGQVIATAKKYLGVPYKWGGTNPSTGLDCSGFVQLVYKQAGISLPRVSQDQQHSGTKVASLADARPGDLVTFGNPATHIGIYLGDGKMIHAPRTGDVIKISPLHKNLSSIRRVLPDSAWTPATASAPAALTAARSTTSTAAASRVLAQAPAAYQKLFLAAEEKYGVPADLLAAVAKQESDFNPRVVSSAGARGLMQLMPGTARGLGVTNSFDPAQAVDGAARLLRSHLRTFGSVDLALAAYNAGPGAVRKYGGIPPYAETRNYVAKITANLRGRAA